MTVIKDKLITLNDDEFIVTRTDTRGNIIYCNRSFLKISGYREKELLGQPHNINRHPEMPRIIFKMMWERIQAGNEFCAYIKSRCRDGSYFWGFSNITPCHSPSGELVGYQSVRRHPRTEALDVVIPLYDELLKSEQQAGLERAMEASQKLLQSKLEAQRTDYDQFILSL
ncbi:MAG: PAS domain-containing protein [Candidatus Sedimenticola sp. 6PFRAG5]